MFIVKRLALAALSVMLIGAPAFALTAEQRQIVTYDAGWYDPNGGSCGFFGVGSAGSQTGSWNSGLQPPYILQEFMIEVLKDIAQKTGKSASDTVTKEHVLALVAFADGEGGDINNGDLFNPLNTGVNDPTLIAGAHSGSGVQSFKSFDDGVEATARGLTDGGHTRLSAALTDPNSTAEQFMYAITYFQKYPGNTIWAEGSDPAYHNQGQAGQDAYYQRHLTMVQNVRAHYANIAGLVIGTPAKEQVENLTDIAKLDNSLLPEGASTTPNPSNDISNGASGATCSGGGQ